MTNRSSSISSLPPPLQQNISLCPETVSKVVALVLSVLIAGSAAALLTYYNSEDLTLAISVGVASALITTVALYCIAKYRKIETPQLIEKVKPPQRPLSTSLPKALSNMSFAPVGRDKERISLHEQLKRNSLIDNHGFLTHIMKDVTKTLEGRVLHRTLDLRTSNETPKSWLNLRFLHAKEALPFVADFTFTSLAKTPIPPNDPRHKCGKQTLLGVAKREGDLSHEITNFDAMTHKQVLTCNVTVFVPLHSTKGGKLQDTLIPEITFDSVEDVVLDVHTFTSSGTLGGGARFHFDPSVTTHELTADGRHNWIVTNAPQIRKMERLTILLLKSKKDIPDLTLDECNRYTVESQNDFLARRETLEAENRRRQSEYDSKYGFANPSKHNVTLLKTTLEKRTKLAFEPHGEEERFQFASYNPNAIFASSTYNGPLTLTEPPLLLHVGVVPVVSYPTINKHGRDPDVPNSGPFLADEYLKQLDETHNNNLNFRA